MSENYLAGVIESMAEGVLVVDTRGRVVEANSTARALMGMSLEEIRTFTFDDWHLTGPQGEPLCWDDSLAARIMRGDAPAGNILRTFTTRGGERFEIQMQAAPLFNSEGAIDGIVGTLVDVKARKAAETALRDSDERFAAFLENLPAPAYVQDLEGRYLYMNAFALGMLGMPREEVIGRTIHGFVSDDIAARTGAKIDQVIRSRAPVRHTETRLVGGDSRDLLISRFPIFAGEELAMVGVIALDITEEQRALRELAEREARIRAVLHATPDLMLLLRHDGTVIEILSEGEGCSFFAKGTPPGHLSDFLSGRELSELLLALGRAGTGDDRDVTECEIVQEKQDRTLEARIVRCGPDELIALFRDVTLRVKHEEVIRRRSRQLEKERGLARTLLAEKTLEQIAAEEALKESERRMESLVKASPLAIITFDVRGVVLRWNAGAERMFGWSAAEVVGRPNPLLKVEDLPEFRRLIYAVLDGSTFRNVEVERLTRNGQPVVVSLSASARYDAAQKTRVVTVTLTDVGEQRRAREEADASHREQATIGRIIASLASTLSLPEVAAALTRDLRELGSVAGAIYLDEAHGGWRDIATWGLESSLVDELRAVLEELPPSFGNSRHATLSDQFEGWEPPLIVPLCERDRVSGSMVLFPPLGCTFSGGQSRFFLTLGNEIGFALENAVLFGKLQNAHERLQQLSRQVLEAGETERRRIALELHDHIGQVLTALIYTLETVRRSDSADRSSLVDNAEKMVSELHEQVRKMSLDLRPAMLDDFGLLPTLLWHFERYSAETGIQIVFDHRNLEGLRIDARLEIGIYRIVQEAVTNVARHAATKEVAVRAWATSETLCLQIEDRGVGFDTLCTTPMPERIGLGSMSERAALMGGALRIESEPGRGTTLMVEIPLRPSEPIVGSLS